MKFNISILDYLGKLESGVLVLISIIYNEEYYEGTFFYTVDDMVLTISEELEDKLGHPINEDENYIDALKEVLRRVVPYKEMYNRIDEVDLSKWNTSN